MIAGRLGLAIAAAAVAWPLFLGAAVVARRESPTPAWTTFAYVTSSRVCHQRPERSFHTEGVQWPVCARCSGLYLGGAFGVLLLSSRRVRRAFETHSAARLLVVAATPSAITLAVEHLSGLPGGARVADLHANVARMAAALPLGAVIAAIVVLAASGRVNPIR